MKKTPQIPVTKISLNFQLEQSSIIKAAVDSILWRIDFRHRKWLNVLKTNQLSHRSITQHPVQWGRCTGTGITQCVTNSLDVLKERKKSQAGFSMSHLNFLFLNLKLRTKPNCFHTEQKEHFSWPKGTQKKRRPNVTKLLEDRVGTLLLLNSIPRQCRNSPEAKGTRFNSFCLKWTESPYSTSQDNAPTTSARYPGTTKPSKPVAFYFA